MWTQAEISQQIRDTLLSYDPDISLDVGTPERKIVDAVASVLASIQVDKFVTSYGNDINSKFGSDLDDFVSMFGMSRQAARAAVGYVTFSLGTTAQTSILIPAGTLVSSPANATQPEISFTTVSDVVIAANTSSVEAIVNALIPGSIGNVPAGAITTIVSGMGNSLAGVTQVTNYTPISGGVDQETDAQLKTRYLNTIFRNISGTLDQFLGLTLGNSNVTKATAIGPVSTYAEYVQLGSGTVTSSNTSAKYIYNTNYYVNSDGTDSAIFYSPGSANIGGSVTGGDYYWTNGGIATSSYVTPELIFNSVVNPAPTLAGSVIGLQAGQLTGVYQWAYSYVYNPGGESAIGSAFPTTATALLNQEASLSVPVSPGGLSGAGGSVAYRNIYRSSDGGNTWGFVTTLYDNVTTSVIDNNLLPTFSPPTKGLSSASIVYLNYQYISNNSRNYYGSATGTAVTNKIDIYAVGNVEQNASDVLTGPGIPFVSDSTSKYYYGNYTRGYSTAQPVVGNNFIQTMWTPLYALPSQLVINGVTYNQGAAINYNNAGSPVPGTVGDYWLIKDMTNLKDSVQARDGIEISAAMGSAIGSSTFTLNYTFNDVPLMTQEVIDQHKQLGQDVLVHLAQYRYFRVYLVAIYENGFSKTSVDQSLASSLTSWFNNNLTFSSILEPSSILQQVYNNSGIVTAKFASAADTGTNYYGIQEVDQNGNPIGTSNSGNSQIILQDNQIAVFYDLGPTGPIQKSVNTWS